MNQPEIYSYTNSASFLRDVLGHKCSTNPSFSVRAWAKQMGLKSHSSLIFLLNGQRQIRSNHLDFLLKGLKLNKKEALYFSGLVQLENASSDAEQSYFENQLRSIHPSQEFSFVDLEKFRSVANWYHMAILEMTELACFKNDVQWIAKKLDGKITPYQVTDAIDRLLNLGLIVNENGRLKKTKRHFTTPEKHTSKAIQLHHQQVLKLASNSLETQSLKERYGNSCAMTIDTEKLPLAVELILEFRTKLAAFMEKSEGDATYQLSIQFFNLTNFINEES